MKFIDTHCHIVPGVDDGAGDEKTSLEMGRLAYADGISKIIATPHITEGFYDGSDLKERLGSLRSLFQREDIAVELVAGAEVPMSLCIAGSRETLSRLTMGGGRYLLVETGEATAEQLAQAAYNVRLCGLYPIFAHPERTVLAQRHPDELARLISRDRVYVQATAASIHGLFGKTTKKAWEKLAREGLVHLLASDAHSPRTRAPKLSDSYEELRRLAGETAADIIMFENPAKVLAGEPLASTAAAVRVSKRGIWSRFRR